jgi:hypothetical protein
MPNALCPKCGQRLPAGSEATCPACAAKPLENIKARQPEQPRSILPEEEEQASPSLLQCPSCGKKVRVPRRMMGRQVRCAGCGEDFLAERFMAERGKQRSARLALDRPNVGAGFLLMNWCVIAICGGLLTLVAAYVFIVASPPGPKEHFGRDAVRFVFVLGSVLAFSLVAATVSTVISSRRRARLNRGTMWRRWAIWGLAVLLCAAGSQPLAKALIRMRFNRVRTDIVGTWQVSYLKTPGAVFQEVTFYPDGTGESGAIGMPEKRPFKYEILPDGRNMIWDEGFPTKSHRQIKFSDQDQFDCWEDIGFTYHVALSYNRVR